MVIGIILAAGEARRMGKPKQLLDWGGKPLIYQVVKNVKMADFNMVRVVLGAYTEKILPCLKGLNVEIVFNPEYRKGQSTSVKIGLDQCVNKFKGAAFILGDQPLIKIDTYNHLIQVFNKEAPGILIPTYNGKKGNPIFFHQKFFPQLLSIRGDRGGRDIITQYPAQIKKVEVEDPGILIDIDSQDDYLKARKVNLEGREGLC